MSQMNFDDSFPKRIAIARNALGLTQEQLAQEVGIVRRQIAAYEAGTSKPRMNVLHNLAAVLGTSVDWLAAGAGKGPNISHVKRTVTLREIPVFTHIMAGALEPESAFDDLSISDFIPAPPGAGERSFAIRIQGDSMATAEGISFPEGSVVTFDPDLVANNGDYILCTLSDFDTTFKQLVIDQGKPQLKPLNPAYSVIMCTGHTLKILAVAIHVQTQVARAKSEVSPKGWNPVESWWDNEEPSYNFEAEIENQVTAMQKKLEMILSLLNNKKPG